MLEHLEKRERGDVDHLSRVHLLHRGPLWNITAHGEWRVKSGDYKRNRCVHKRCGWRLGGTYTTLEPTSLAVTRWTRTTSHTLLEPLMPIHTTFRSHDTPCRTHTHTHTHTHIHTQSHRSSSWFGIRHQPSGNNHIHKGTTQGIYCEARWEHHVKEKEKRCMSLACGLVPPTHPQPASGPATCEVALNIPFRQISFLFSRIIHFHHHTNNQHK